MKYKRIGRNIRGRVRKVRKDLYAVCIFTMIRPKLMSGYRVLAVSERKMDLGGLVLHGQKYQVKAFLKVWIPLTKSQYNTERKRLANKMFEQRSPILW